MVTTQQQNVTFQESIDIVESLPPYQQEDLIHIIKRRLIEINPDEIAENVKTARAEFVRGEIA